MGYYQIKKKQIIKTDIDTLWSFVSRPENLNKITPNDIGFQIINHSTKFQMGFATDHFCTT